MTTLREAIDNGTMKLSLNPDLDNTTAVHDSHMNVLITGGKDYDRAMLQDVVFNALEGAGFQNLTYTPNGYSDTPAAEVKSMLDSIKESNPEFFLRHVSIETADRAWDTDRAPRYPNDPVLVPVINEEAWNRITTRSSADSKIKMEVGDGAITIRF